MSASFSSSEIHAYFPTHSTSVLLLFFLSFLLLPFLLLPLGAKPWSIVSTTSVSSLKETDSPSSQKLLNQDWDFVPAFPLHVRIFLA